MVFSVVVVTHNSAAELEVLLSSLQQNIAIPHQVIVVDNNSSDQSVAVAHAHGAEVTQLDDNIGFGKANNIGVAQARSPITALLNPDIKLLDGGLLSLVQLAQQFRSLLAPRLLNSDGSIQRSVHPLPGQLGGLVPAVVHSRFLPDQLRGRCEPWRMEKIQPAGWAIAACLVAQTHLLKTLGPFDPNTFMFYEDMDLCLRARKLGIPTLYEPNVCLSHAGSHSTKKAYKQEPHELLATRRRKVVKQTLGKKAQLLDDVAQLLTFITRIGARVIVGIDSAREKAQLNGLLRAMKLKKT